MQLMALFQTALSTTRLGRSRVLRQPSQSRARGQTSTAAGTWSYLYWRPAIWWPRTTIHTALTREWASVCLQGSPQQRLQICLHTQLWPRSPPGCLGAVPWLLTGCKQHCSLSVALVVCMGVQVCENHPGGAVKEDTCHLQELPPSLGAEVSVCCAAAGAVREPSLL